MTATSPLPRSVHGAPSAPTALSVRAFGTPAVLMDGREVAWRAQGSRDLLFYLLSHPQGRTRDDILADLWTLDPTPASTNRFRVTLHRLRAALGGTDTVLEDHGRYRLAPEVAAVSDVHELYAALRAADAAPDSAAREAALGRALAAYRGPYLPDERAEWAERAREEHETAFVRVCVEVSLLCCERTDCVGAVRALGLALGADPYLGENYHQRFMTCLSVVEDRHAAIAHYRRFLRFLRDDVNDTPLAESVRLAARIKDGEQVCEKAAGGFVPRPAACAACTACAACASTWHPAGHAAEY